MENIHFYKNYLFKHYNKKENKYEILLKMGWAKNCTSYFQL